MSQILIIDDVAAMRDQYAYDLQRLGGFATMTAAGGSEGLDLVEREHVDCIILDLEMPGVDGFEVLATLKRKGSRVPIIVYTGTGNYDRCTRAVKLGAYGFIAKDEPLERVVREVENALAWADLRNEVRKHRRQSGEDSPLVGESRAARAMLEQIDRLAVIPSPVLILGESGSGKELVARRLHDAGPRAKKEFVPVNCAALPETMVESELFGHERGAFTGADKPRPGAFATADKGTLFLDEVGDLPAPAQAKLLRVLEDGVVTRLGSSTGVKVDARVVAATNRDLEAEVSAGRFREDLLYRLNAHTVRVPPLRERLSDVPLLVDHFLALTCEKFGMKPCSLDAEALGLLQSYDWMRNNVRELRNVIERMVIAGGGPVLGADLVPSEIATRRYTPPPAGAAAERTVEVPAAAGGTLRDQKAAAERQIILTALERNDWHITNTAAQLGLADHSSLLKIMRRHGLKK
jgi:DNA-binding NtrC family response regulator